jgi:outer membrane protein
VFSLIASPLRTQRAPAENHKRDRRRVSPPLTRSFVMNRFAFALAAGTLAVAATSTVRAQSFDAPGFYAAIGYYDVAPKSSNGVLANTFHSDIDSDAEPTVTLGYRFDRNWSAEAWLPLTRFQHDVKLDGATSASIKHQPILLTAQYHFLPNSAWQPFIGAGYGWVNVSDERTRGPIAGTNLNVDSGNGFVGQFGVDYAATANVFIRADARYFDWKSDVQLNGAGIGSVKVNPWIYGVSVGYRF